MNWSCPIGGARFLFNPYLKKIKRIISAQIDTLLRAKFKFMSWSALEKCLFSEVSINFIPIMLISA